MEQQVQQNITLNCRIGLNESVHEGYWQSATSLMVEAKQIDQPSWIRECSNFDFGNKLK
jgi:nitric oxide reductase large subunit